MKVVAMHTEGIAAHVGLVTGWVMLVIGKLADSPWVVAASVTSTVLAGLWYALQIYKHHVKPGIDNRKKSRNETMVSKHE